jgi:hypothetical protein
MIAMLDHNRRGWRIDTKGATKFKIAENTKLASAGLAGSKTRIDAERLSREINQLYLSQ